MWKIIQLCSVPQPNGRKWLEIRALSPTDISKEIRKRHDTSEDIS